MGRIDTHPATRAEAEHEFGLDLVRPGPGIVVLAVRGDVDLHVAEEFEQALRSAVGDAPGTVIVDFSKATFLDSMALGVLLGGTKRIRDSGGRLRVVAPGSEVRRILEITHLDRVFQLDESREEALQAAKASESGG
jgi:anti-sigma B factor antagonist